MSLLLMIVSFSLVKMERLKNGNVVMLVDCCYNTIVKSQEKNIKKISDVRLKKIEAQNPYRFL